MDCTTYNEVIGYNEPINYNGVCISPPASNVVGGGFVRHDYHTENPKKREDEFGLVLTLFEMLDDD